MADITVAPSPTIEISAIPLRELLPWLLMVALVAAVTVFFISADQGAISVPSGTLIHEWVHDGRHLLGYPCH